jgi:hypothetical protein
MRKVRNEEAAEGCRWQREGGAVVESGVRPRLKTGR